MTGDGLPTQPPGTLHRRFRLSIALVVAPVWLAFGHSNPQAPVPSLAAQLTEEAMTVDGVLEEPFWSRCPVGSGLIDTRTQEPARDQSLIRVAYTREFLYLSVECLDANAAKIRAVEQREDREFRGDDWVEVHFDPPHSHRGKYAFFTNPLGTRADANEGPSGQFNYGWSADWDCAAKIGDDRWTFEMRIPLKVLNYFRSDNETWGFNITRMQRHTDVTSFWSFSATEMYKPRHFGHLTNLNLKESQFDRNWEVTPYASVRQDLGEDADTVFSAGVDVGMRLTPAITAALTINPDYGQIEADDDTIELRDTERFLSERRPFFREGDELIRPPHRVYYSRRFPEIDAALKATGQGRGYSFIFQNLQSDVSHDGDFYGNSSVLRVMQDVRERSYLGYYVADSELGEGFARLGSADGYFFLNDAWRVRFQGAVTDEELDDSSGSLMKDSLDYLGSASVIYSQYPWDLQFNYTAITEEFNPLLGYIPRRDIYGPSMLANYNLKSGVAWYKELNLRYLPAWFVDETGDTSLLDHDVGAATILRNDLGLRTGYLNEYHRPYYNDRLVGGVDFFASNYYKAINLTWAGGTFQDTDYNEFSLAKRFKFWERLPIKEELFLRFEDQPDGSSDLVWLNRVVFDLFIARNMWVKSSIQIRDDDLHNYSIIYGWEFRKDAWFYVVYNDVEDGTPDSGRSLFSKLTYRF